MGRWRIVIPSALGAVGLLLFAGSYLPGAGAETGEYATFAADEDYPDADAPLVPREGSGPHAESVIGPDSRVQVTDTTAEPYRKVALLWLYDAGGLFGSCTGTFIGPDVLMTAAHCLYDSVDGWTTDVRVVPAADGDEEPFGGFFADGWTIPQEFIDMDEDPQWDYGVISLPGANPVGVQTGWMPLVQMTSGTLNSGSFAPMIVGYPGDKPDGTMWRASEAAFSDVTADFLDYSIDTASGQSGAAVFSNNAANPQYRKIAGIHILGGPDGEPPNTAVRVDGDMRELVAGHCQEWECEPAVYQQGQEPTPTVTVTSTVPGGGDYRVVVPLVVGGAPPQPTNTPTQIPTATVAPTVNPSAPFLRNSSWYEDSLGAVWFVGETVNPTASAIGFVEVTVRFYSAGGTLLGTDWGYASRTVIPAGQDSPFTVLALDPPPGWASSELVVTDYTANPSFTHAPTGLVAEVTNSYIGDYGWYHMVGTVTNTSDETVEFAQVYIAYYGSAGQVLRIESDYVEPATLPAQSSASFDVILFDGDEIPFVSTRLWVDGDPV